MLAASLALAVLALGSSTEALNTHPDTAPSYSTASIANAATNLPSFAPNTIVSIYGSDLSYNTGGIAEGAKVLPTTLGGVSVYFGIAVANIFYVSPHQINVLIPYDIFPGPVNVRVVRDGTSGPQIPITIAETAPGLFQSDPGTIIATRADGSLVTADAPANPGEVVVLYAVGLGRTVPDMVTGFAATHAQPIQHLAELRVLIAGKVADPALIFYAGATPGFAGLYQINMTLPADLPRDPEFRIAIGDQISPSFLKLPAN